MVDSVQLDVQYDTGCQLSLINTSALKLLPETYYSLGSSSMINLLAYSFPTTAKWRKHIGSDVTSHSGKVSILLGGDNYGCYPPVIKEDKWGVSLLSSRMSVRHIIFGPVNLSSITWSWSQNVINVMSVSVVDFQEELLMTISAEKYSDPFNREKVIQATKEKGIKEILAKTTVEKINNKVSVKYLYEEEKLAQLGENYYRVTNNNK